MLAPVGVRNRYNLVVFFFLSWELLDDSSRSSLCDCCQSTCHSRPRRGASWGWGIPRSCSFHWGFSPLVSLKKQTIVFQSPPASGTSLCWDPWSLWIHLRPQNLQVTDRVVMVWSRRLELVWFWCWQEIVAWAETQPGSSDGCCRPLNSDRALTCPKSAQINLVWLQFGCFFFD